MPTGSREAMRCLFVIGAAKSGTTSLYEYVRSHPEICASRVKEPKYFALRDTSAEDLRAYESLFAGRTAGQWALDASTHYTRYPNPRYDDVPERIHRYCPEAKFIYLLRNPVERVCSEYLHHLAQGREKRSFLEALGDDYRHMVNGSRYHLQLTRYLRFFRREQLHVMFFDDLVSKPLETVHSILRFIGADPEFVPPNIDRTFNDTSAKTMVWPVIRKAERRRVYGLVPWRVRQALRTSLRCRLPSKRELLDSRTAEWLRGEIADDVAQLRDSLGVRIPAAWGFLP
jgi:hypothetical protein